MYFPIIDALKESYIAKIPSIVTKWLTDNVNPVGSAVVVDESLSISGAAADAKVTGDKLSNLKSDLNQSFTFPTLATSDVISGKYINGDSGGTPPSSNYVCTDFIELPTTSRGLTIQANCFFGSVVGYAFYDDSKTFISGGSDSGLWNEKKIFTKIPSNAKYFRCTLSASTYTNPSDFGIGYQSIEASLTETVSEINGSIDDARNYSENLFKTNANSAGALASPSIEIPSGFVLGDISGTVFLSSAYRMRTNEPFSLSIASTLTSNWDLFTVYVWKKVGDTWSGVGWQNADYVLDALSEYQIVVGRKNFSTDALTTEEQTAIAESTKLTTALWGKLSSVEHSVMAIPRVMNRQGEGYGFPDNSLEGVTSALDDGYKMIRISVAVTSDDEIYCSHVYELENNSTLKYVTLNGTTYTENIDINASTASFIDSIRYKGYSIPKLSDVMAEVSKHDIESITWELKGTWTSAQLQILINKSRFYGMTVILSAGYLDMDNIVALDTNLNIAVIFNYTEALGNGFQNVRYKDKYKTMRYDCYWGDTVTEEQISTVIHSNVKLKFGAGTVPTAQQILSNYIQWVDVSEVNYSLSAFIS